MIGNNSNCHIQPAPSCNDFSLLLLFGLTIATDNNVSRPSSPSLKYTGERAPMLCSSRRAGRSPLPAGSVGTGGQQRVAVGWGARVPAGGRCGGSGATRAAAAFPQHHQPASPRSDGAGAAAAAVTSLLINLRVDDASLASESSRVYLF